MSKNSNLKRILAKCKDEPLFFFSLLKIVDKGTKRLVPFEPKPEQVRLLEVLLTQDRVVVLKGRQIGISTLVAAYYLWKMYFTTDPVTHGLVAQNHRLAKDLLKRMKSLANTLPPDLRRDLETDNTLCYRYADTEAGTECFTAGGGDDDGARGFAFTSAHLTEYARWDEQVKSLTSILNTVGNGQVVIETTPGTPNDAYHKLCLEAKRDDSEWYLFFSPWYLDKHCDFDRPVPRIYEPNQEELTLQRLFNLTRSQLYWRYQQIGGVGNEEKRQAFDKENPTTEEDAFRTSDMLYLPAHLLSLVAKLPMREEHIYEDPNEHDRYVMGVDSSQGKGHDYSAIVVLSRSTGLPVYQYRSNRLAPDKFAEKVAAVGKRYFDAYILVEENMQGGGGLQLYVLEQLKYKQLYKDNGKNWVTNNNSKWSAFNLLRAQLLTTLPTSLEGNLYTELVTLIVPPNKTPQAPKGMNDDLVMAYALAHVAWNVKGRHIRTDQALEIVKARRRKRKARELRGSWMGHRRTSR